MSQATDSSMGWHEYLAVAIRRKKIFLVPLSISLLIGLLVMLFSTRIYEAESLIMVRNEKLTNPLMKDLALVTPVKDRLATLREEILSFSNLSRLIKEHSLDKDIPKNSPEAHERLVQRLRQDILVKMRGDELIMVSYLGRDPAKVQEVVNALTDIVIERDSVIRQEGVNSAVESIQTQLEVYRKKLETSEKKLREFKEIYVTQMPVAMQLNKQVQDLESVLAALLIDSTEDHPRVKEIRRQIAESRRQRDEEVRRLVAKGVLKTDNPEEFQQLVKQLDAEGGDPNSEAAKKVQQAVDDVVRGMESPEAPSTAPGVAISQEGGVNKIQVSDTVSSLMLAPRQQQELAALTRDYTVNEQFYRSLLEKLEKAMISGRIGQEEEGGKFVVIERARYPLRPVKPNLVQVLIVSISVGLIIGIGLAVLVEYMDQSIQSSDEVAEALGLPVLASISIIQTAEDVAELKRRRREWLSAREYWQRFQMYFIHPVWSRVDRVLVKWGL